MASNHEALQIKQIEKAYDILFQYLFLFPSVYVFSRCHSPVEQAQVKQIKKTQDELQWIVAQRLLSALTIPGFS